MLLKEMVSRAGGMMSYIRIEHDITTPYKKGECRGWKRMAQDEGWRGGAHRLNKVANHIFFKGPRRGRDRVPCCLSRGYGVGQGVLAGGAATRKPLPVQYPVAVY